MNISPVGLFRSNLTHPEKLRATTVSRSHLTDDIFAKLGRWNANGSSQNYLFIGPRGIGKTHLLSLIATGIDSDPNLNERYCVLRFPEEANRILSFADLLLGIVEQLTTAEEEKEEAQNNDWQQLYQQIAEDDDDQRLIDLVLPRFRHWHQQTGQVLLLMLENLDTVFTQQIKNRQDIHRIRSLLMDNNHILLLATAPTFFPGLNDVSHPLFDFFDIQVIEELNQEQTLNLIRAHLHWDKQEQLLQQFDDLKPRILAMHELTGGNPRLVTMLYELIVQDNLAEIKTQFHQLLDRITPFYQDRLKDLPPQERALLETLALMRTQLRTPVNIAARFRKSRHQTSTLLKRMIEAGYLSVSTNPDDKRSRLYRIKEGLFDLWLTMNQSRSQRKYLPYLAEFFLLWYRDGQAREVKRQELAERLEYLKGREQENALDMLTYLSDATTDEQERFQTKIELTLQQIKLGRVIQAKNTLLEIKRVSYDSGDSMQWITQTIGRWVHSKPEETLLKYMERIIEYWREQRTGDLEKVAHHFNRLNKDFSTLGLHEARIALLSNQLGNTENTEERLDLLLQIANARKACSQLSKAIDILNEALSLTRETHQKKWEGVFLSNIGQISKTRGDYETALDYLQQSLATRQEIGDKASEGSTLNNISQIFKARGDYETALGYLQQSLAIMQEIGDKAGEGTTLNDISQIHDARGDYETALGYLQQSLAIMQEIGDKAGEGTTLNNISQIFKARGDYETALGYLQQSLAIMQEIGDKAGEGTTLNNISQIHDARGDYETALGYLQQSLAIQQEIGNVVGLCATLFNMGHIHLQNEAINEAIGVWIRVYRLAKSLQLAQVLEALEGLAGQLGGEGGLLFWEQLPQRFESGDGDD